MRAFITSAIVVAALATAVVVSQGDALLQGFQNPPDSAKPRVWWHWMSGNVTKDGIKADLEWMKRSGIGGFQNFDANLNTPQIVEKRLVFMTPEWKDAFKYATTLADQLGLEMAIAGSPGWSESGGPWVTPAQAMKKYVWSETRVDGGRLFTGVLPKPPSATGPYQNQAGGRGGPANQAPPPEFYADAAVVAYPAPDGDRPMSARTPKVTSSGGAFDVAALTDGNLAKATLLPAAPVGERAWIQYELPQAATIRGVSFITAGGGGGNTRQFEVSDDGSQFRVVTPIPTGARTIAFAPVTARVFRVSILTPQPQQNPARGGAAPAGTQIAEFLLHGSVVNRFQEKAAFSAATNISAMATPTVPAAEAIRKADVIDLTSKMRADGALDWTPPAGNWVVLRIGYSLTGSQNRPASPEATGLEVDKLNKGYVKAYFDNYLDQYKDATGGLMGKRGLQYVITDSWEAGVANWTDDMIAEFARRRGYDIKAWLPALTGRIVESAEASDRFLWDFRKTLSEMTAEYHYDQLTEILKARGMARYTESHENGRAFIGDGMEVKANAAVPMSAMWTPQANRPSSLFDADIRESASVAHIYGQNLVAAESLTAGSGAWSFSPETLKPTADRELSMGLNRFVIHTSVHQPVNDKIPGLGLGPYGQWFTRHETWAEQAKVWTTYLARSSYLLQQGRFVADIAYYYGEDSNVTALFQGNPPPIPAGYNFDYVNSDVIKNRLTVSPAGLLTTATGMSYRVLALDPNSQRMPLAVLRKIRAMVNAGAIIVGPKPIESPSLSDDAAEFKTVADQLWGGTTGKGKVLTGSIADALASLKVAADFEYTKPQADTELAFVHRTLADGDLYWVSHRNARAEDVEATFRVQGKAPELWHAETGAVEPASYRIAEGRTIVSLTLQPNDAVFVVFRKAATAPSRTIARPVESKLSSVEGSWDVAFQPNRGAPAKVTLPALVSWHEHADPGVKYFSGTGTYSKTIQAPADWFQAGAKLWLDLGDVKNIAEVTVNGKFLGTYWKAPFRVDVTSALKPGANTLEIKVVNLWVNRLIGDQQEGVTTKYTYTAQQFYRADSPLLPSGLIGPVQVVRSRAAAASQGVSYVPANGGKGVNPDAHLVITFPSPPALGNAGRIRIYDATDDGLVDTLDLGIPPGPTTGPGALAGRVPYTPVPYEYTPGRRATNADTVPGTPSGVADRTPSTSQLTIIGGFTDAFHFYPVTVCGNVATICPHNNLLRYGRTYYVQIDPGVLTLAGGGFTGVSGRRGWTFSTKPRAPAADSTLLVVAADGTGDFNTVQGALDFVPDRNPRRVTIFIRNGDYEEIVYFRNKSNLTLVGEDRERVQIHYANSEIFNPHPSNVATNEWPGTFPSRRAAFMADQASGIHLVNLTIGNTARGQAEGLLITGERNIVSHASIYGSGDALQVNGSVYLTDSLITGDGDTILGRGPAFFTNCELQSRGPFTWTRNTAANHGNVFLNCRFKGTGGEPTVIARAPANGGRTYSDAEVVLLSCALDGISAAGWGEVGGDASQVHYWEYNSTNLGNGAPADVRARHPVSKRLTMDEDAQTIANYSNPDWVLGGWSPAMAPIVLNQPASVTVTKGRAAELSVTVAAIPDAAYQWFRNGTSIAGATGKTLRFAAVGAADAGVYTVKVTNDSGTATSRAATLTVK